jgi:hypothetical protein
VYTVHGKVQRWGNSYGVRLRKRDMKAMGLRDGSPVELKIVPTRAKPGMDLTNLPTFRDPDPLLSIHHDEILYGPQAEPKARPKRKR